MKFHMVHYASCWLKMETLITVGQVPFFISKAGILFHSTPSFLFLIPDFAGPSSAGDEDLPTYKDAFPPLPEKASSPEGTQEAGNAWTSKIRPLKSSVITQV